MHIAMHRLKVKQPHASLMAPVVSVMAPMTGGVAHAGPLLRVTTIKPWSLAVACFASTIPTKLRDCLINTATAAGIAMATT